MSLASLADKVLIWIHARRLGLTSDARARRPLPRSCSMTLVGSTRGSVIVVAAAGRNGKGGIMPANVLVGDNVVDVAILSTPADASAGSRAQ